jgi:hypothetical protein
VFVALKVAIQNEYNTGGTYLTIVEVKPMQGGLVTVDPNAKNASAAAAPVVSVAQPPEPPAAAPVPAPAPSRAASSDFPLRPPVNPVAGVVPAGTVVPVRMIDSIDSSTGRVGQSFRASVAEDVAVSGITMIPRGSNVLMTLIQDQQAGRLAGKSMLRVGLVSVNVNGREVALVSSEYTQSGASKTKRSVFSGLAGAGLGAAIGGLAGGGTGAMIGAGSGTAAGVGVQAMLIGPKVRIPSETVLMFTLQVATAIR